LEAWQGLGRLWETLFSAVYSTWIAKMVTKNRNICNRLNNLQALGTNVIKNIDIDTDGKTKYMHAYNNSYTFPKVDSICESRMILSRT
jgi:hypothetical protein